ncbi:MAG: type IV pilus modification protein PilV [Burkholderiales bacterium]
MKHTTARQIAQPALRARLRTRGFSLLEVLVALLVIAFGLLGIAGMQALSISNTSVAGFRSIAALQASSMAAAMSANEMYWQPNIAMGSSVATATATTVSGSTVSSSDASLNSSSAVCTYAAGSCSPAAMAAYDLQQWGAALANALPNGTGAVNCVQATATTTASCKIVVYWVEKSLVQNQATGASATAGNQYDFEMMVEP